MSSKTILALFLLKVGAGILLGWMSQKFYSQGNDYWGLNDAGWKEYQFLFSDPKQFFLDILRSPYHNSYGGFFDSMNSYWNDLKNTLVGKLLAFCDIFSRGNYYINALFLNFFGFFGPVALYRVFIDVYKNKKWQVITGCFLLPSALYFSSGIHRDLFVFAMLGLYCYAMYFSLQQKPRPLFLFIIAFTFFWLFIFRNFVAVALIPATIAWIIAAKKRIKPLVAFASIYIAGFLLLWLLQLIKPSFQPLKIITTKQQAFLDLPIASSQISLHILEPEIKSFIKNIPQALNHSMLRPYLWEHPTNFLIPLAVELFCYQMLFILMIFFYQRKNDISAFTIFGLFLSFSLLLFTGYIVPNLGSIVRYRSLYIPFLITPVLCSINWLKINKFLCINI